MGPGAGAIRERYRNRNSTSTAPRVTNERILAGLGMIDTVLTPGGKKRKAVKGLRGAPGQELDTLLGE